MRCCARPNRTRGAAPASPTFKVDLAALGLAPGAVPRVVDLVEAGLRPARLAGGKLEFDDGLEPGAARLYSLHAGQGAAVTLFAVKRGADVALSFQSAGSGPFELLRGPDRTLDGASVDLVPGTGHTDPGAVPGPAPVFYAVE